MKREGLPQVAHIVKTLRTRTRVKDCMSGVCTGGGARAAHRGVKGERHKNKCTTHSAGQSGGHREFWRIEKTVRRIIESPTSLRASSTQRPRGAGVELNKFYTLEREAVQRGWGRQENRREGGLQRGLLNHDNWQIRFKGMQRTRRVATGPNKSGGDLRKKTINGREAKRVRRRSVSMSLYEGHCPGGQTM